MPPRHVQRETIQVDKQPSIKGAVISMTSVQNRSYCMSKKNIPSMRFQVTKASRHLNSHNLLANHLVHIDWAVYINSQVTVSAVSILGVLYLDLAITRAWQKRNSISFSTFLTPCSLPSHYSLLSFEGALQHLI